MLSLEQPTYQLPNWPINGLLSCELALQHDEFYPILETIFLQKAGIGQVNAPEAKSW
jgi:hypothetical protein